MQLVPVQSQAEIEIAILTMQIAWKMAELDALQERLMPMERLLEQFERQVSAATSATVTRRNHLKATCDQLAELTTRIHVRLVADPDAAMDPLFGPAEIAMLSEIFGASLDLDDMELHATTNAPEWDWAREEAHFRAEKPRVRPKHDEPNMRSLYRQLARSFHPDLTQDEDERAYRQEMMLRVNLAWDTRDLSALKAIYAEAAAISRYSLDSFRVMRLREDLRQLTAACDQASTRIQALRASKTRPMWHDPSLAKASIGRHLSNLRREIADLELMQIRAQRELKDALAAYLSSRIR